MNLKRVNRRITHSFGRDAATMATAVAGTAFFLAAPEFGIPAAATGLAMGAISATLSLTKQKRTLKGINFMEKGTNSE